jgi:HEAT repeat protein
VSLEAYLRELADPEQPLAVAKLTNLSALRADEATLFSAAWAEMELSRRQQLIQELSELAEDNVELNFDAVYFVALGDRDPHVRVGAIRGLWEYAGRDLIDVLLTLLESDADAAVRAEAALALGRFVVEAEFDAVRPAAAERVEQALRRAFEDGGEVLEVRSRALESLGARSADWVRELVAEAFHSAERRLRLSAAHAMGRSCDSAWLPDLIAELESDDAEMRYEAAGALGSIADEAAAPALARLLDDEDAEVQQAAIAALGEIGGGVAKEALKEVAASAGGRPREAALAALAEIDFAEDPLGFTIRG